MYLPLFVLEQAVHNPKCVSRFYEAEFKRGGGTRTHTSVPESVVPIVGCLYTNGVHINETRPHHPTPIECNHSMTKVHHWHSKIYLHVHTPIFRQVRVASDTGDQTRMQESQGGAQIGILKN